VNDGTGQNTTANVAVPGTRPTFAAKLTSLYGDKEKTRRRKYPRDLPLTTIDHHQGTASQVAT